MIYFDIGSASCTLALAPDKGLLNLGRTWTVRSSPILQRVALVCTVQLYGPFGDFLTISRVELLFVKRHCALIFSFKDVLVEAEDVCVVDCVEGRHVARVAQAEGFLICI